MGVKEAIMISRSSTKAEYHALALIAAEIMWVQALLGEIYVPMGKKPPLIYCDNLITVMLAANPILHYQTKYIKPDLYFFREKVQQRQVVVSHVPSTDRWHTY